MIAGVLSRPRRGKVGDMLGSGEVVETKSGRLTTPFPRFSAITPRNAASLVKKAHRWLMENARLEAESRGDHLNAAVFALEDAFMSRAERDSAEEYLFGAPHPPLAPSILNSIRAPDASGLYLDFRGRRMTVSSLQHAQALWVRYRNESGRSPRDLQDGVQIFRGHSLVATVSYNGRVWSPTGVELPFGDGSNNDDPETDSPGISP